MYQVSSQEQGQGVLRKEKKSLKKDMQKTFIPVVVFLSGEARRQKFYSVITASRSHCPVTVMLPYLRPTWGTHK